MAINGAKENKTIKKINDVHITIQKNYLNWAVHLLKRLHLHVTMVHWDTI